MRIGERLSPKQKKKLNRIKKKNEEKIDWEEIMGTKRQTYKRVKGAVRNR